MQMGRAMKTATIPSLRVDPELRQAVEAVLENGETLSGFVEQSVRDHVERRRSQKEFIARGLLAREQAKSTGEYFGANRVLGELESMLAKAEAKSTK